MIARFFGQHGIKELGLTSSFGLVFTRPTNVTPVTHEPRTTTASRQDPPIMQSFGADIHAADAEDTTHSHDPIDPSQLADQAAIFLNSTSSELRKIALRKLNHEEYPDREKFNLIGLKDPSPEVRAIAASFIYIDLPKLTPLLLNIAANDPSSDVRLSASLNLNCQFTCNGVALQPRDVRALESDIPLLIKAISYVGSSEYILGILDDIWCDMNDESRALLTAIPTFRMDDNAKRILESHSDKVCR